MEDGFENAIISIKEIATEMDVELKFREKYVIRRKKQFDENIDNEVVKSPKESFKNNYLFIKKLKSLDSNNLKDYCLNLERSLKHNNHSNIGGLDLFTELKINNVNNFGKCCFDEKKFFKTKIS
ncbi:hypothetical protein HKD37_10G028851 [Glycine soja]